MGNQMEKNKETKLKAWKLQLYGGDMMMASDGRMRDFFSGRMPQIAY